MSTTLLKPAEANNRKWYVIDAAGKPLGRVAAEAAVLLRGKNKVTFTPNVDCGDHVIVINCDQAVLTGKKLEKKFYYFGLVTIGGLHRGSPRFVIPNEVVREQIYTYLLDNYHDNHLHSDSYRLGQLEEDMAYDGSFKPFFQYIADSIYTYSSQRDRQKGEAFVHGYTLALTSQCRFYRPISELDNQGGYADIFLCPHCEIFTDMEHSYIIELKYLKSQSTDDQVGRAVREAQAQVCRYADTVKVNEHIGHTRLHKVYVVYRGVEMVACEEVEQKSL